MWDAHVRQPTEQVFLKDVADLRVEVLRDDGMYRHIKFRRPRTTCMGFDLVTWPGYLCYSGDMGTFVFSRVPDMFEFFRDPTPGNIIIHPQYWSEKVQAEDRPDGVEEYSPDRFREAIENWLDSMEASAETREAAKHVLAHADDGEYEARRAVSESSRPVFQDFWEARLHEYTYRFIWCCYALVWGIRQYDIKKTLT